MFDAEAGLEYKYKARALEKCVDIHLRKKIHVRSHMEGAKTAHFNIMKSY